MPEAGALGPEELDLLQELMNVAFGEASAALAAARGGQLGLEVPDVQVMPAVLVRYYLGAELKGDGRVGVVAQAFRGELEGSALLVLPEAVGAETVRAFGEVLVPTCVARLAELLGTEVRLEPALHAIEGRREAAGRVGLREEGPGALVLRSTFQLGASPETGHLFLAASRGSIAWLAGALPRVLARYA